MSKIIEKLVDDHKIILEFVNKFEQKQIKFMEDNEFELKEYQEAVEFIRNFADKEHHQREEKILFKYMMENMGEVAEKLIRQGMYVEHDLGRYYIGEMEKSYTNYSQNPNVLDKLNIIGYGQSYCQLIKRHIEKEDTVVFPFAQRSLSEELFKIMEKEDEDYLKINKQ